MQQIDDMKYTKIQFIFDTNENIFYLHLLRKSDRYSIIQCNYINQWLQKSVTKIVSFA